MLSASREVIQEGKRFDILTMGLNQGMDEMSSGMDSFVFFAVFS
jgi:hypothetical protein